MSIALDDTRVFVLRLIRNISMGETIAVTSVIYIISPRSDSSQILSVSSAVDECKGCPSIGLLSRPSML